MTACKNRRGNPPVPDGDRTLSGPRRPSGDTSTAAPRWLAYAVLPAAFVLYLLAGRYPSPGFTSPERFFADPTAKTLLLALRLPRALGAMLMGATLAGAGAAFQTVFGNPLVDAGFLGVSPGAAFGAGLALVLFGSSAGTGIPVAVLAFVSALIALAASIGLSRRFKFGGQVLRLILAGLAVSAFFSALLAALKYIADPLSELPDIVFWTMGSLQSMGWSRLGFVAPFSLTSLGLVFALRWRATVLSLDDDAVRSLGLHPARDRALIAAAASLGVAAVTAACGIVSWIGLVVPQFARMAVGSDGRAAVPCSMALGAIFGLVADGIARTLFPGELPLGIVTALMGAALFSLALTTRSAELSR